MASEERRMPIIGNGRPRLATFALLDVDTGLTDRPVNHRRLLVDSISRARARANEERALVFIIR